MTGMLRFVHILVAALSFVAVAHASESCVEALLAAAPVIAREADSGSDNTHKLLDRDQLRNFVTRLSAGQRLQKTLQDGEYEFLVTIDGELLFIPNTTPVDRQVFTGSHDGLAMMVVDDVTTFTPKAAGEFYVRGGAIAWLNNRSGTYRAKKDSLELAKAVFDSRGVPFAPAARILAFEDIGDPHAHQAATARMDMFYKSQPEMMALAKYLQESMGFLDTEPLPLSDQAFLSGPAFEVFVRYMDEQDVEVDDLAAANLIMRFWISGKEPTEIILFNAFRSGMSGSPQSFDDTKTAFLQGGRWSESKSRGVIDLAMRMARDSIELAQLRPKKD